MVLTIELYHHARGILNKYSPLLQACCSVFPIKFAQDLVDRAGEVSLVLIFDICNVYDWLYSQCCGRVKMVDMASKFLGNIEHWRLLVRVIWICETAKLSKFVLSNFQRMT